MLASLTICLLMSSGPVQVEKNKNEARKFKLLHGYVQFCRLQPAEPPLFFFLLFLLLHKFLPRAEKRNL